MRHFGLVGYPLGHSFSARYFTERFAREGITDATYDNYPIESIDTLGQVLPPSIRGFNITIPHKQAIIPLLAQIDLEADAVGAVNCVKVQTDGSLKGYNTDVYGFELSLIDMLHSRHSKLPIEALVLGTGGASRAVCHVLDKMHIPYIMVSRTANGPTRLNYEAITPAIVDSHKLIINTTPLGTAPHTDQAPDLPYNAIGADHYLLDLVYNPSLTRFLRNGLSRGAHLKNGFHMLVLQADRSWQIWNDSESE